MRSYSVSLLSLLSVVLLLGSFACSVDAISASQLQAKASGNVRQIKISAVVPEDAPSPPSPTDAFLASTLNFLSSPRSEFQLDPSAVLGQLSNHAARASKAAVSALQTSYDYKRRVQHTQSVMAGGSAERIIPRTRQLALGDDMPPFNLSPAQQQQVADAYGTDPKALGMRNQSPRFRGNTGDTSTDMDYLIGIGIYFGIGVVIGTLNLLCTGLYMFCRCCCWRYCCKKQSEHELPGFPGYLTFFSKYWPVLLLAAFVPLACAFAIVGITYNNSLSRTFSTSDQEHGLGPLTLNAITDVNAQISGIVGIAQSLVNSIPGIARDISAIMPASLQPDSTALKANATQFGNVYAAPVIVLANQTSWSCNAACAGITASSALFVSAINSQVQPAIDSLQDSVNSVQQSFLDSTSGIQSQLNDATSSLNDATTVFDQSLQNDISDYASKVEKYDKIRNSVFLALFSLVFLSPLLTVLGLMLKRGCPFRCTFCLGPFYCWIIFFLFGLHWFLGMAIGDACVYLDKKMVNVAVALDGRGGTALPNVLNACFTSTSLVTALALEQQLNFSNIIHFPTPLTTAEINQKFTIPALDSMVAGGQALTTADFGLDETATIDNRLTTMSGLPDSSTPSQTHTFTRTNLPVNADASTFSNSPYNYQPPQLGQIVDLYNNVVIALNVSSTIKLKINRMNADINNLVIGKNRLQTEFQAFSDATAAINTTLTPALKTVDQMRGINCGKLGQDFGAFKNTLCNNLGNSIQFLTLALFFVSFSCCGIAWFSRWSAYRVDFVPRIAPAAFDEQAWMVANGYAPAPAGQVVHTVPAVEMQQPEPNDAGTAMNVPSYQDALASYKNPEQQTFQAQSPDDQFGMEKPNDWADPIKPQETNDATFQSPEEAAGVAEAAPAETATGAPEEAAESPAPPSAPAPQICESCEKELVSIHCDECEEDLCAACDDGLHKSAANQGHTRTAL